MSVNYLKFSAVVFCFGFILFFNQFSLAQDIIELKDNSEIKALIEKIEGDKIFFKKYESFENNTLFVYKSAVRKIYYRDGSVVSFDSGNERKVIEYKPEYTTEANDNDKAMFDRGVTDAGLCYDKYKAAGTVTLLTSLVSPLIGLIPAIACSSTAPSISKVYTPKPELKANPEYVKGYTFAAKKIKSRKVWKNFGIGLGVNVFFFLGSFISGN